ncbi:uncharacterized protein LOC113789246 [Dermatophagoides pteronyssinus]|uniref:uncharacterized protein LOC113789246 n=1 Tax=Dermatophagoides pteronyssinus TaxID=6956 RepID=UPI003F662593
MSDNIFIDGKPLNSLRVVDLKEELRKRGVRSSGTKSQLQQLLLTALYSKNQVVEEPPITDEAEPIKNDNEQPEKIDDSMIDDCTNSQSIDSNAKFASISINEEKETIKLTIRSSPRKQEPVQQQDSESEDSQSDATDPDSDRKNDSYDVNANQKEIPSPSIEPESKMESEADNAEEKSTDLVNQEIEKPENSTDDQKTKVEHPIIDECKSESESPPKTEQTLEEFPKNKIEIKSDDSKSRTSIIKNRMITQKSTEKTTNPVQKKRRWGSSQTNESSVLKKGISSDELKQLINDSIMDNDQPAIKVSKPNEDKTFFNNKTDEPPQQPKSMEITEMEIKKVDISFKNEVVEMSQVATPQKENGNIEDTNGQRSVSPAKNPESTVLFITGLVRPYTLMQLKKLLNSIGEIDEEKFWIDKIKSKCYVTYSSVEEAVETRKNLHNLKWPQSSPKNLCVEFATLEDIDRCLHPENYEDLPMKNVEKKSSLIAENKGKYDIIMKEPKVEPFGKNNDKSEATAARGNIREWDRDKVAVKVSRHEEKEKSDDNQRQLKKPKVESPSDHQHHHHHHHHRDKPTKTTEKVEKKEEKSNQRHQEPRSESPVNSLEDLFRKTKTIPYIYWLPLNDEQALEREKYRNQLEKEREARIAQRMEMSARKSSPPLHPAPMSRDMNRIRRTSPINFRRKPSHSPVYRRNQSRYSRSRSPDRRRFSPRRR